MTYKPLKECIWKAAIYLRTSKGVQTDESDTLENQLMIMMSFLKKNPDIVLTTVKTDNSYSGLSANRPAYREMLLELKGGIINCIVVKDLSRFSRNHLEAAKLISEIFPQMGVRLIAITDNFDSLNARTDDYNLMIPIKTLINQSYSMDISKKITIQLELMKRQGLFTGAFAPYGYKRAAENHHKLVPDEPAATVVRQMFQWRLEGYSSDGISCKLNQLKVLTPSKYKQQQGLCYKTPFQKSEQASRWSAAIIIRILSNAVYTGVLEQGKTKSFPLMGNYIKKMPKEEWIITEDAHQALVTKACFETIQRILYTDTRCAPGKKLPYPLIWNSKMRGLSAEFNPQDHTWLLLLLLCNKPAR